MVIFNQTIAAINSNEYVVEEVAAELKRTVLRDGNVSVLVWLCRESPVLVEAILAWKELGSILNIGLKTGINDDILELLEVLDASKKR